MYINHFRLQCPPFEDRADARFFFATRESEALLKAMREFE